MLMTNLAEAYCDTCGSDPCVYPPFCEACRLADRNARVKKTPRSDPAADLKELAIRAKRLADRWRSGELQKTEAVDSSYSFAVALGLSYAIGDDVVQFVLASAFACPAVAP